MSDEYDGPTSFVPDEFEDDNFADEVDPDALAEMEAEQEAYEARMAGQSGPRKLDFQSYSSLDPNAPLQNNNSQQPSQHMMKFSQQATAPQDASLSLNLHDDDDDAGGDVDMTSPEAVMSTTRNQQQGGLSHFQLEQLAEAKAAAQKQSSAIQSNSSANATSAALPPLLRSISEARQKVMDGAGRIFVYSRQPALGLSLPVTNEKGERVFLTMESEEESHKRLLSHLGAHRREQMHRELGQVNLRSLLAELEREDNEKAVKRNQEQAEALALESDDEDDERTKLRKRRQRKERLVAKLEAEDAKLKLAAKNKQLWVDKYAPRSYADLLSPEQINREVLEWLKGWDTCVFGEKKLSANSAEAVDKRNLDQQMLSNRTLHSPAANKKNKQNKSLKTTDAEGVETDVRPEHKVILLCGPPGLGKTTLAHILAKQAGYHPYEINASDDRNATVLETKIRSATEMQAVSFGDAHTAKPNCIILDEIDGVAGESGGQGAIAMLVKIVQAEAKSKKQKTGKKGEDENEEGGNESSDEEEEQKEELVIKRKARKATSTSDEVSIKKSPLQPLRRPIICICNDQYAAALRPLRAIAKIFEFTAAPKLKFVDRLKYIVKKEHMEYDPRTLGALADIVDLDIRSALNTLQFVHNKGQRLTANTLNNLALGRKDVEKSRSQVWDAVFSHREVKRDNVLTFRNYRETENHNQRFKTQLGDPKFKELQGLLNDAGDMDKIMEGIFHNYPTMGYTDPSFYKTVECADWLTFSDVLEHRIQSEVEYSLGQYAPYPALAIHQLTSRPRKVAIENPSSIFYHIFQESQRHEQILRSFLSPTNIFTLRGTSIHSTVLDVVPQVLDIVHPSMRAVNLALLTTKERADMANLVDTMLSLSLSFRAEVQNAFAGAAPKWNPQNKDGMATNVVWKLDPPIDLLSEWTNPLEETSIRRFEPKDKFGNSLSNRFNKFQRGGAHGQAAGATAVPVSTLRTEKRDVNMPGKAKQMLQREVEFEAMRRNEAKMGFKGDIDGSAATENGTDKNAAPKPPPSSPSLISPAVQKLLAEEERRKRDRLSSSNLTSPDAAARAKAQAEEDENSPATKKAKMSASMNFLNAHADAAKNKQRNRTKKAVTGAKLDLAGLKTEREKKESNPDAMDESEDSVTNVDASISAEVAPAPGSSVLSRFTHSLHFKFNEGCTNAVRRTVPVAHFLPL